MHQFYFNDCLSQNAVTLNDFVSLLVSTIKEYNSLVKKNIDIERGIILEKETEKIVVCKSNLKQAIMSIPDIERETRNLAFAYFTKFPIQYYLHSDKLDDKILEEQYSIGGMDATNLAIAKHNRCFLFSVAVHKSIKKNILLIKGKSEELDLDNLYGEEQNTQYIESQIRKINAETLGLFDKLKAELKKVIYTNAFEKSFKSAEAEVQLSIVENFAAAPCRELKTPYFPDNKKGGLIRDVTPDNNRKKAKIYELRVYYPEALRVYFYEYDNTVFISSIGYKKDYKEEDSTSQTRDIKRALTTIDNLIKTR